MTKRAPNPWLPLRWPLLASAAVLLFGVLGYAVVFGWSFIDAIYMTVSTMTTVGLREVRALDTTGKLFTVILLIAGATVLVLTLSVGASILLEGEVAERRRRKRMQRRVDDIRDHVIVAGYGRVAKTVVEELVKADCDVVVIERDHGREHELIEDAVPYVLGDATEEEILHEAGLERARAFVSAVDSDPENIFITLAARTLNQDVLIVARASEATTHGHLERAGANTVFSPYIMGGRQMAAAALMDAPRVRQ
jgi:voltage-gated potassium channel